MFYSGKVDGISPKGTLVRFNHEGIVTTPINEIVVEPLTPSTSYLFKVSAVAPRGEGMEVIFQAETDEVDFEFGMESCSYE